MSALAFTVADLRDRPDFGPAVADRVWRAWWRPKGEALAPIASFVETTLGESGVPSCFIAHDGAAYRGSALLIASDLDLRPDYTPWIAAVWVEADHRARGIGSALVRAGTAFAAAARTGPVHICAMPHTHGFYRRLGWFMVEADVDGHGLAVFRSPPDAPRSDGHA